MSILKTNIKKIKNKQMNETKKNLKILLLHLVKNYDRINNHFDMKYYRSNEGKNTAYYNSTDCGTVGCLLGFVPECIPVVESDYNSKKLYFYGYATRVFKSLTDEQCDFLFSSQWKEKDNTLQGAIARLKYFLDNSFFDYSDYLNINYTEYLQTKKIK
jgi:hypothetical protein